VLDYYCLYLLDQDIFSTKFGDRKQKLITIVSES